MMNTTHIFVKTSPLSCVWIETGNPRQPLACVWMEDEIAFFKTIDEMPAESEGEGICLCA